MATEPGETGDGSAADSRSDYDYRGGGVERPALAAALRERVDGEVRFDEYSRELYATDASIYERLPVGVVFPESTADVAAVVSYCADEGVPVLPRGGGTSLAGQTVNEAVVLDFSKQMDGVVDVDPGARRARAQPGVTLAELNDELAAHGLKFAPDPAWGDKSVLGGAIGNNSTGSHSLQYGKTDAYLESVEVVLADGTVTTFEEVSVEEARRRAAGEGVASDLEADVYATVLDVLDEQGDLIRERYPALKRSVSGYNLDWLVEDLEGADREVGEPDAEGGRLNLAKLLAGSEGTLAVVTEAEVSLEPVPETKAMALLAYENLQAAMEDVATLLAFDPAAVELVDDVLIDLARDHPEFGEVVGTLPDGTEATLLVEFYADDDGDGRRKVAELLADRQPSAETADAPPDARHETDEPPEDRHETDEPVRAFAAMEAHGQTERDRFWKLRKAGLPILLSRTSDEKHISFIEDAAVPPAQLPGFVADFQDVLDDHDTFASFYGHAGPGVLHVRPLVNTKPESGVERMESIAREVTELVVEYGGSVSGEHGDGRARTQWNHPLYGDELWATFQRVKAAFDPDWLLNPGQVVGRDAPDGSTADESAPDRADTVDMTEHLRTGPGYDFDLPFDPTLEWDENGVQGMVELCHGCGGCRGPQDTTGGVMCPTYRASEEELTSTRGRANMLRQAMSGDLPADPTDEEFRAEVLDLCIGCKGCKHDCPSGVDMAKLKAEVEHAHVREHGPSLRDRLFAGFERAAKVGSALAPLSNWATKLPGAGRLAEKALGIARERDLPTFRRETVHDWFAARGPAVSEAEADRRALLVVDTDSNYSDPAVGKAAVRVIEAAGVHVELADTTDTGRPAHSRGLLDRARATAETNLVDWEPRVREGWDVVLVEPSDAVMVQSDYRDLLGGAPRAPDSATGEAASRDEAAPVADSAYGVCEYLDRFDLVDGVDWDADGPALTYHGHCHQKATKKDHHAVAALRRAGHTVDPLDSGCCGMAGSFGYEAEHYAMSQAIGDILFDQVEDSGGERVVAPGVSCRTQLEEADVEVGGERPAHPVEVLAGSLPRGESP